MHQRMTLFPKTYVFRNDNFCGNVIIITIYFSHLPPASSHLHSLQVENCDSNSRLVVDGDDNGKFSLERVKDVYPFINIIIFRHLELKIASVIPVSNE